MASGPERAASGRIAHGSKEFCTAARRHFARAAGGIRCLADAVAMLEAGATRLGTSHGAQILGEFDALVDALSARRGDAEARRA